MSATPESRRHATLVVKVGDQKEEIDEMIAPLIRELWIAGISTAMSCQEEYRETAWIEFHFIDELERFLNIVAEYDAGGHSLYAQDRRTRLQPRRREVLVLRPHAARHRRQHRRRRDREAAGEVRVHRQRVHPPPGHPDPSGTLGDLQPPAASEGRLEDG